MGGGGGQRALGAHVLDDGDGECRALHRVGARPQLVEQDQAPVVRLLQYLHGVRHVRRERGQALLNALLVAHVRQYPREHLHRALIPRRDMQTALRHKTQQPQRFQRHGLAAGVGARDHQRVIRPAQRHRHRHRLRRVEERVPRPLQVDAAPLPHQRTPRVHGVAQLRPGKDGVQLHQQVVVIEDVLPLGGALPGQDPQHPVDLLVLLGLQLLQLVVGLHHAHRLHKQRGTGGGYVVDKSRQTALALRLHGHHEPPVPLGDEGFL